MPSIELDLHTHTIASGHGSASTITDMAKTAALRGLRILGISDHGPATFGGGKPSYFRSLSQARRKRLGVEMLYGAEVNILDQRGSLDLDDSVLAHLDYVIASMHRSVKKPGTKEENTAAYIAAMRNPFVCILGHCDDVKYPIDPLAVVKTAIERQVLLEINDSSLRPDGYRGDTRFHDLMLLNLCKHYNYPVLLSSDSHGTAHVGDVSHALELVRRAGIPDRLILNYSAKNLKCFLAQKNQ